MNKSLEKEAIDEHQAEAEKKPPPPSNKLTFDDRSPCYKILTKEEYQCYNR